MAAYKWKTGSYIPSSVSADAAGALCGKLSEQNRLTAEELVKVSRPETAPLHKAFEWDDQTAAEEYRKYQARHIISCLCVVTEQENEEIRAFFNIQRTEPTYRHISYILESPEDSQALLKTALSELDSFRRKYGRIRKLIPVFDAIDIVKMEESDETG